MNSRTAFPVVLFDLDGTLSDFFAAARDGLEAAFGLLAGTHIRRDRFYDAYQRQFTRDRDNNDPATRLQRFASVLKALDLDRPELAFALDAEYRRGRLRRPQPVPGAPAVLALLSRRRRLGVVTDGPGDYQREHLRKLGVEHFFEMVLASGDIGYSKPRVELFAAALETMHATAENTVMIGDNPYADLETPHSMGMKTILFTGATTWYWERTAISPFVDRIATSFDIIPALVAQLVEKRLSR
ncbi:HAD family hydrolase [bacterium]|nr:HAD family hydrolase [candidate division CSSED10-310 bacterium]